jgi:UDP-N-acetylmuramate dehydrogenase
MNARCEPPSSMPMGRAPPVRGRLTANAAIGKQTWFGVGGAAEILFQPADAEDLAVFLAALPTEIPVTVIGTGSNLLVRDGGVPGATIRLGRGLGSIAIAQGVVHVGAGALDRRVAVAAAKAGLAGLEFLSGIPGTIGGSLRTNAGAYGVEIGDVLVSAAALDRGGRRHVIDRAAMALSYRHCGIDPGCIFIEARLRGIPGERTEIAKRLMEIRATREATQPIRARTSGSTFANPPGRSAWQLIDAAGCRGLARGGAMVSHKHANFLINTGSATAADIEGLAEEVRRRVYETSGIMLEWEIQRIGRPAPDPGPIEPENANHPSQIALQRRSGQNCSDGCAPL